MQRLKADGSYVTWGLGASGEVNEQIAVDVQSIYCANYYDGDGRSRCAFAALNADGSVLAWGSNCYDGDGNEVNEQLTADSGFHRG